MSLLKAIKVQLGLSVTPSQNFTITSEASDGSMKLARGNAGATTQDILTVDASGNVLVDGNNLNLFSAKSLATNGYQKLPSGLIIQWGTTPLGTGDQVVTFPITFPNAVLSITLGLISVTTGAAPMVWAGPTVTGFTARTYVGATQATSGSRYIAIGY